MNQVVINVFIFGLMIPLLDEKYNINRNIITI